MNGRGPDRSPGSMLEIYMEAVSNSTDDDFLDSINLGVGNYTNAEYWQQIQAFRRGMFADAAMGLTIANRAKRETQKRMVDAIFDEQDEDSEREAKILRQVRYPDPAEGQSKEEYLEEHMQDVWEDLGISGERTTEQHQAWLVSVCTGISMDWTPPHWRMLKAKHEASRSKDAILLGDLFGRPPENDIQPMEDFK